MNKDEENTPTFYHSETKGHDEKHCWNLCIELKPKWAHPRKCKEKTKAIFQDLQSDSEDKTHVTTMGIKGKSFVASFSLHTSSTKDNVILNGMQIKELFHL
jgi:hypothetical protein